jgi:putative serine protease PepD
MGPMSPRALIPFAALLAAAVIGGLAAVGLWEAVADEESSSAPAQQASALPAAEGSGLAAGEVYRRAAPGVVEIRAGGLGPDETQAESGGSGFVIDEDGHIVTNQHVVQGAETVTVVFANGDEAEARVVGADASTDIALLELADADRDLTPLQLGSSTSLAIGDPVVAIGSPFGLEGTLTTGVVSGLDRELRAPDGFTIDGAIQTDAALNRGNSGGPLLDRNGRVVGVTSQIESTTGGNVGIGYAVPIETVRTVVEALRQDGEIQHAYLGVQLQEAEEGVVLADVVDGGPADRAGVEAGDVVTEVDGKAVESAADVRAAVTAKQPGDELTLEIRRDGSSQTIEVELGQRPS